MAGNDTLNGDRIRSLIAALAEQLEPADIPRRIIIAGGSLLAWHGLRDSTTDIDSLTVLDSVVVEAVSKLAQIEDLSPLWLNDHARPFAPNTLDISACDVLVTHNAIQLLGVPLYLLFLMKLDRALLRDVADLVLLWPRVHEHFDNAKNVVLEYQVAYPNSRPDEHLAGFVDAIIAQAQ